MPAAAERLTANGGFLLILSGLHGFVPLARVLEPYDVRLGGPGSITTDELREQARSSASSRPTSPCSPAAPTPKRAGRCGPWRTPRCWAWAFGYQRQHLAALRDGRL